MEVLVSDATITPLTVLALVLLVLLLLALALILIFLNKRRKQKSKLSESHHPLASFDSIESSHEGTGPANDNGTNLYTKAEALLPNHISLCKNDNLKEKSKDMANQIENLEEFSNMVEYAEENFKNKTNIATMGDNTEHNRYIDIGTNCSTFPLLK